MARCLSHGLHLALHFTEVLLYTAFLGFLPPLYPIPIFPGIPIYGLIPQYPLPPEYPMPSSSPCLGPLSPDQEKLLKKAFEGNDRMIGLVNEMLSINHTEEASLSYNPQPTDIVALIDNVVFDFVGESYKRGVELLFLKPDSPLRQAHVDQGKIRFVIQNLIENAIKYSNEKDKVLVSTHEENNMLVITVKDTGIGINDADKIKIFEKFFRTKNAKEKEEIGTGLGLYTSKNIIEKHGGTMTFQSTEGQGTTFSISLPFESKI